MCRRSLLSPELVTTLPLTTMLVGVNGQKNLLVTALTISIIQEKPNILRGKTDNEASVAFP